MFALFDKKKQKLNKKGGNNKCDLCYPLGVSGQTAVGWPFTKEVSFVEPEASSF